MRKKMAVGLAALGVVVCLSQLAMAGTVTISVTPDQVPDETQARPNFGDAPTGWGPNSWQGPAGVGKKTNWYADGSTLNALFGTFADTMTINDLASLSYNTKRPTGTDAGEDWFLYIYTKPTGTGDAAGWYHQKFINDSFTHTDIGSWVEYSTVGASGMRFGNVASFGAGSSLAELQTAFGTQQILFISVQTGSTWNDNADFNGYMDGLTITLNNGNVGRVDFTAVPLPSSALMGLGLLGGLGVAFQFKRRRRASISL